MENIISTFSLPQFRVILILIVIDVVLGIIGALIKKEFILSRLAKFMKWPVLGYLFGFAILIAVAQATTFSWVASLAYILIILALLGSIGKNLAKLGLPLPNFLKKE